MKVCAYCGHENGADASSCDGCGGELRSYQQSSTALVKVRILAARLFAKMTTPAKCAFLALTLTFIVAYFALSLFNRPRMTEAKVVGIANAVAAAQGFRLSDYYAPQPDFASFKGFHKWTVTYELKVPGPWDLPSRSDREIRNLPRRLTVAVDDRTEQTLLMVSQERGPLKPANAWPSEPPHLR